ncbi:MAG TPA: WD40 repeat domain-containing protein, partial [Jiangellaceae bacterium]|nr:WD40 repeat domain-containing protein [Jiangellaceae bacterium]
GIRGQVLYGPRQNGAFSEGAVRMLTDAHLVRAESRRGATWYELAHDRLIEPVKEDNARWREVNLSHFERLATWWDEQNRPDQALLTGPDLVNAETWVAANAAALSPREQEFFEASRKAAEHAERERRATKRTRRWLVIAVVGCVLAAAFGVWAWQSQQRAEQLAGDFEISVLAGTARDQLESDVDLGLLLAQQAVALPGGSPSDEDTQNALQLAVDQTPVVGVLRGHGPATGAVYSPDGESIATYHDDDGVIVVWDAESGNELYSLTVPGSGLINPAIVFSPDSAQIAAVAADGRVAVWPAETDAGEPTWITPHEGVDSWQVAFSPDGTRLASLGITGLAVVEVSGQPVLGFDPTEATDISGYEVEWTPDGESLVIGDVAGVVSVWDADTGQRLRGDITHPTGIVGVDISPDGSTVASASNNLVLISNLETGDASYNLDRGGLTDISFSSDGSRVVVIDQFGTALVIDPERGEAVKAVTATGMSLVSVDVDPTEPARAVMTTVAGEPAIWDVAAAHSDFESAIEPLPDGGVLTTSFDGSAHSWTPELTPRQLMPIAGDPIQDASVSSAGDLVAVARESGAIDVWPIRGSTPVASLSMGDSNARAVALSPDGRFVAGGGADGRIMVWEVRTGYEIAVLEHTDSVVSVDFGADETQLVSASWDETAIVWDLDGDKPRHVLRLGARATAADWSDSGNSLAVAGEDGSVQFFDPATGLELHDRETNEHAKKVNDIAFDRSGAVLVSASEDRSLVVWNADTGSVISRIRQGTAPWRVTVTADGNRVIVGDGTYAPHVVFLDGDALLDAAQEQTTRELTEDECGRFLGDDAECLAG